MRRMQGTLSDAAPAELCLRLAGQAATGALRLQGASGEAVIQFRRGLLVSGRSPATTGEHGARLGERLVAAGAITADTLDEVLAEQREREQPLGLGQLLVDRDLVSARLVRLYLLEQILDSVLDTVGWSEGDYGFEPGEVDVPDGIDVSIEVHRALMEVRRRDDERARIEEQVPAPTAVHRRVEGAEAPTTLDHDEALVLSALDGEQSVGEVTARLGLSYGDVSRLIYRLALHGLVESAEPDDGVDDLAALLTDALEGNAEGREPAPDLADEGWAEARDEHSDTDEPEPWVGYAHGAPPEPEAVAPLQTAPTPQDDGAEIAHAAGAADTDLLWPDDDFALPPATLAPPDSPPASTRPVEPASPASRSDLFSALHEVQNGDTTPTPEPTAPPEDETPREPARLAYVEFESSVSEEEEEVVKAPRPSTSDVSALLAELHALNTDPEN